MSPFLEGMTLTYFIFPLMGLLLVGVGLFLAKKNQLLGNKRIIGAFLLSLLVLVLPSLLGFLDYKFMPYGYMSLVIFYIVAGWYNIKLLSWIFKGDCSFKVEIMIFIFQLLISMALFALVFNLTNELQYGGLASTVILPFIIVSIFMKTYHIFMSIPVPIYKVWKYSETEYPNEHIDPNTLQILQIELYKELSDLDPTKISIKAPDDMNFGLWFRRMVDDYNMESPQLPIDSFEIEEDGGWIFYVRTLLSRRVIDPDLSIKENKVKSNHVIVAERVKEMNEL